MLIKIRDCLTDGMSGIIVQSERFAAFYRVLRCHILYTSKPLLTG